MIQIISTITGATIGYTEKPRFIKISSSGVFIQTDEENAQGIAYRSKPYNLRDREGLGVEDTVMLIVVDSGTILTQAEQTAAAVTNLEDALCEQDTSIEERLATIEDALCELDKEA